MAMEWMNSGAGCAIIMCLALLLGVISGMLVRRKIWLMVSLLGVVAGFFSGAFIYAMIYSINGWDAVWGYYLISITFAIIGFLLSLKLGKSIVITGTSMIGSYLFMRAWTLFFPGHYPSESEIVEDYENVELDDIFWVFFGMFIACFIGSMVFQCTTQKPNDELEEAYKKVD